MIRYLPLLNEPISYTTIRSSHETEMDFLSVPRVTFLPSTLYVFVIQQTPSAMQFIADRSIKSALEDFHVQRNSRSITQRIIRNRQHEILVASPTPFDHEDEYRLLQLLRHKYALFSPGIDTTSPSSCPTHTIDACLDLVCTAVAVGVCTRSPFLRVEIMCLEAALASDDVEFTTRVKTMAQVAGVTKM